MVFSTGMPKRSHRVTSALFLMVRKSFYKRTRHIILCQKEYKIYEYIIFTAKGLRIIQVWFLLPGRYGELVATHPWKAIIACLAITIAGGSGLLRCSSPCASPSWLCFLSLVPTQISSPSLLSDFTKKEMQPAWSFQEILSSERILTGKTKIFQER